MELNDLVVHGTEILRQITPTAEPWQLNQRYTVASYDKTISIESDDFRKTGVDTDTIAGFLSSGFADLPPPEGGAETILRILLLNLCNDGHIAWYTRDTSISNMLARVIDFGLLRWRKCILLDATESVVDLSAPGGPLQVARFSDIPKLLPLPTTAVYHDLDLVDLDTVLGQVGNHTRMVFYFTDAEVGSSFVASVQAAKPDLSFHATPVDQSGGRPLYVGYAR
jgi:hypothetical protein